MRVEEWWRFFLCCFGSDFRVFRPNLSDFCFIKCHLHSIWRSRKNFEPKNRLVCHNCGGYKFSQFFLNVAVSQCFLAQNHSSVFKTFRRLCDVLDSNAMWVGDRWWWNGTLAPPQVACTLHRFLAQMSQMILKSVKTKF